MSLAILVVAIKLQMPGEVTTRLMEAPIVARRLVATALVTIAAVTAIYS